MDVMKRSHRFSYAAAFGTLAHLCSNIVFDAKYAFHYNGPTYLKGLLIFKSLKQIQFISKFHIVEANVQFVLNKLASY